MELVIHQERKGKLEEVLDGVNDAVIIQLLSKNTIYSFVEDAFDHKAIPIYKAKDAPAIKYVRN